MVEMADKDLALTPEELDAAKGFFSWIKSQDDGYSIMPGMAKNDRDFFKIIASWAEKYRQRMKGTPDEAIWQFLEDRATRAASVAGEYYGDYLDMVANEADYDYEDYWD